VNKIALKIGEKSKTGWDEGAQGPEDEMGRLNRPWQVKKDGASLLSRA